MCIEYLFVCGGVPLHILPDDVKQPNEDQQTGFKFHVTCINLVHMLLIKDWFHNPVLFPISSHHKNLSSLACHNREGTEWSLEQTTLTSDHFLLLRLIFIIKSCYFIVNIGRSHSVSFLLSSKSNWLTCNTNKELNSFLYNLSLIFISQLYSRFYKIFNIK